MEQIPKSDDKFGDDIQHITIKVDDSLTEDFQDNNITNDNSNNDRKTLRSWLIKKVQTAGARATQIPSIARIVFSEIVRVIRNEDELPPGGRGLHVRGFRSNSASEIGDHGDSPSEIGGNGIITLNRHTSTPTTNRQRNKIIKSLEKNIAFQTLQAVVKKRASIELVTDVTYCQICMENIPATKFCKYSSEIRDEKIASKCEHHYCKSCMKGYLNEKINSGEVLEILCPMLSDNDCSYKFLDNEIEQYVDKLQFRKYLKFKLLKIDDNYRECPNSQCQRMILGKARKPKMTCESCGQQFCFHHSIQHDSTESCSSFIRRKDEEENKTKNAIIQMTRKCPQCGVPTEKNGGCNHITCPQCRTHWCWLCRKDISEEMYQHYNLREEGGCIGGLYTQPRNRTRLNYNNCTNCYCYNICCNTCEVLYALMRSLLLIVFYPLLGLGLVLGFIVVFAFSIALLPFGILSLCIGSEEVIETLSRRVLGTAITLTMLLTFLIFCSVMIPYFVVCLGLFPFMCCYSTHPGETLFTWMFAPFRWICDVLF